MGSVYVQAVGSMSGSLFLVYRIRIGLQELFL